MMAMLFTVVMPSFLGYYIDCAKDREAKFIRAVESIKAQTYPHWEIRLVADGCDKTVDLFKEHYFHEERMYLVRIPKRPKWDNAPRNLGIEEAEGEYVVYLDTDDVWGPDHLSIIHEELEARPGLMWGFFNDMIYSKGKWVERHCDITKKYRHGTANIVHRAGLYWPPEKAGQQHDFYFVQYLRSIAIGERLRTPQYYVHHIARQYDV